MENMFRDLTVSAAEVGREEEDIRALVRELPDDKRRIYFERIEPRLRDPDTYAVLNWMLVGAHHLYLGRWFRGLLNLASIVIALLLIFGANSAVGFTVGCMIVVVLAIVELLQLFRSQTIVMDYNNQQARLVLRQLG